MNKRQRRIRIRQVQDELVALIKTKFPLVEHIETEDRPSGTVAISIYAPYEDTFAVLEATGMRLVDLATDENLPVLILPMNQKADKPAKRPRSKAA